METRSVLSLNPRDFKAQEPHSLFNSIKFTLSSSAISSLLATGIGASYAMYFSCPNSKRWKGRSIKATAFITSTNCFLLSVPFFGIREGVLHYRYFVNDQRGIKNNFVRRRDDTIASATSGLILGSIVAYHTRGPWAIFAGAIVYGCIATFSQSVINVGQRWRQNHGLYLLLRPEPKPFHIFDKENFDYFREEKEITHPVKRFSNNYDPLRDSFTAFFEFIREYILDSDFPDWASPLVKAMDSKYHEKLIVRIEILKSQIEKLKDEIQKNKLI